MDEYLVPAGFGEDEFTEKKSRFIGSVWRCETEEEALAKIREMNEKHRDAGHRLQRTDPCGGKESQGG